MNVLIVGNSDINGLLEQKLLSEGFSSETLLDCSTLSRLKGRPGAFELYDSSSGGKYTGAGVIVTERAYTAESELPFEKALNLLQPGAVEKLMEAKERKKIAFLLDYGDETPEWLTVRAYEAAIGLADAKKDVMFLSMFAKAASAGMEKLYLKARQAGVTFIKYERADAELDEETGVFTVTVNDGVFETAIETPCLITVGARDDTVLASLGGKLRVSDKKEIVSEFRFFLNPALTTRRGVYHIHKDLGVALPYIVNELRQIEREESVSAHAEIDAGKCAFCYSCYRACPHAALEPDIPAGAMACTENACMACGVCVAICPGEAITLTENPVTPGDGTPGDVPFVSNDTKGTSPGVPCKVFCCENSAGPAFAEIAGALGDDAARLSLEEIPCGGSLGHELITEALASFDKVLVAVCIDGACRHMNGGKRACKQAERAAAEIDKLAQAGKEPKRDGVSGLAGKRVKCVQVSHAMPKVLLESVKDFLYDFDNDV